MYICIYIHIFTCIILCMYAHVYDTHTISQVAVQLMAYMQREAQIVYDTIRHLTHIYDIYDAIYDI